jgi:PST family polysaccharide transporter
MRYRTIAVIEFGSYVAGYCVTGITSALAGSGVWSLVYAAIGQSTVMTIWSYASTRHDIRPLIDREAMRAVSSFTARVSLVGFLEFLTIGLDNIIVGRYAGMAVLGQYNRAMLIATLPLQQIATAVSKVLFPAFSRVQLDDGRLRSAYLDSISMTTLLFLPMAAVMGAGADNFVRVLLGEGWNTTAHLVPILAAAAALHVVVYFPSSMAEAIGRVSQKAVIEILHLTLLVLGTGIVIFVHGGLFGLVSVVLLGRLLQHALYLVWMDRVIPGSLREVLTAYVQSAAMAVAVGLAVAGIGRAAGEIASPPVALAAQVITVGLAGMFTLLSGRFLEGIRVARQRSLIPAALVMKNRKAAA